MTDSDETSSFIDLELCQTLLDKYKATLQKQRRESLHQEAASESTNNSHSKDVQHPSALLAGDSQVYSDEQTSATAAETASASDLRQYVDWDTMQQMSEAAATKDSVSEGAGDQCLYATVKKSDRDSTMLTKTTSAPTCTATTSDCVVLTDSGSDRHPQNNVLEDTETTSTVNQHPDDGPYSRLNSFHTTTDNSQYTRMSNDGSHKNHVTVTSHGVEDPIRFVVRTIGSFPMSDASSRSKSSVQRKVHRVCERTRSDCTETLSDVVCHWPTDVDIALELSGKYLRLIDESTGSELFSQRLNTVKQWSAGQGTSSRYFSFVSPEPRGGRFACHVFRCCGDYQASDITSTLHQVCSEMQKFRQETSTRL